MQKNEKIKKKKIYEKIKVCYKHQKGSLIYPFIQMNAKIIFARKYKETGTPSFRFFQTNAEVAFSGKV